jgi:hypothetical protein
MAFEDLPPCLTNKKLRKFVPDLTIGNIPI